MSALRATVVSSRDTYFSLLDPALRRHIFTHYTGPGNELLQKQTKGFYVDENGSWKPHDGSFVMDWAEYHRWVFGYGQMFIDGTDNGCWYETMCEDKKTCIWHKERPADFTALSE